MNPPHPAHIGRREFIQTAAATALVGALHTAAAEDKPRPQTGASRQLTVAGLQMLVSHDLAQNEAAIRSGITAAAEKKADFLLTPEVALTGFGSQFEREPVAAAAARLAAHAKKLRVGLLLGTGYKELEDSARAWLPAPTANTSTSLPSPAQTTFLLILSLGRAVNPGRFICPALVSCVFPISRGVKSSSGKGNATPQEIGKTQEAWRFMASL